MSITTDAVLRHVEHGLYDEALHDLEKAVIARLNKVRKSRSADEYGLGDRVVFNNLCDTKYIRGESATVVGKERTQLLVKLDRPVGRFSYAVDGRWEPTTIKTSPSVVDHVK